MYDAESFVCHSGRRIVICESAADGLPSHLALPDTIERWVGRLEALQDRPDALWWGEREAGGSVPPLQARWTCHGASEGLERQEE
jgi:hypothetical protein